MVEIQQIKQELANLTQFLDSIRTQILLTVLKIRTEDTIDSVRTDLEMAFGLGLYKGKYRKEY
jgi:hypothetical protein